MTAQQYVEQDHSQADNDLQNAVNIAAAKGFFAGAEAVSKSLKPLLNAVKKLCDAYEKMRLSQRTLPPDNIKRRNAERIFRLRMEKLLSLQKKTEK